MDKTYYIETYGCTFNQSDSEKIEAQLVQFGFKIVELLQAKIVIINTCAVKQTTEAKLIARINQLTLQFPDKYFIITGCLPQIDEKIRKQIEDKIKNRGKITHPNEIFSIVQYLISLTDIHEPKIENACELKDKSFVLPIIRENTHIGIVQLSEGCSYNCTYCCTKLARGKLISFDFDQILIQIKYYLSNGLKEIFLTSQDLGLYNYQNNHLYDLLIEISKIPGDFFIRLGMLNPNYLNLNIENFLKIFEDKRFFRFLHIPIQSGSNEILQKMRRPYKIESVEKIILKIKEFDPNFTISTDIITGFPTETEDDHRLTMKYLEKWKPDVLNISKYSNRPNTDAKKMPQVKSQLIKQRSSEITNFYHKYIKEINSKWIGWSGKILINEPSPLKQFPFLSRNLYYKSILCKDGKMGDFGQIKIIDYLNHNLIGERV